MSILQRVVNMTKAAANELLDKMENPVMMLNHYLRDLDDEIAKAERSVVQQQVQERVMLSKYDELNGQSAYYESKAEQAAAEGREAEARTALEAMLLYREQGNETSKLVELAKKSALDLELHVEALKEEKSKLQAKREELVARVRSANYGADAGFKQPAYGLQGSSASRGFERIEQKVMEWEAERELSRTSPGGYGGAGAAAVDLKQEERNALVEEQLQRLLQKKSGQV